MVMRMVKEKGKPAYWLDDEDTVEIETKKVGLEKVQLKKSKKKAKESEE